MSNTISTRKEILFIYDVKDANPNGDPLDENKPRIDEETGINIVTDVRLKRTIRDYLFNFKGYNGNNGKDIFVRTTESNKGGIKDGKERLEEVDITRTIAKLNSINKESKKSEENKALKTQLDKQLEQIKSEVLNICIDLRLFGGVLPMEGNSFTFTGPVQFKIGRSLHRVELNHIKGTGAFASDAGKKQQTFREEYILPYSLIAFYGIINENAAQHTKLTEDDVELLYDAMWNGTKNLISRSKMLHTPRLLVSVDLSEPNYFIGELDKYIQLNTDLPDEKIRDVENFTLDCTRLKEVIGKNNAKIKSVKILKDDRLKTTNLDFQK